MWGVCYPAAAAADLKWTQVNKGRAGDGAWGAAGGRTAVWRWWWCSASLWTRTFLIRLLAAGYFVTCTSSSMICWFNVILSSISFIIIVYFYGYIKMNRVSTKTLFKFFKRYIISLVQLSERREIVNMWVVRCWFFLHWISTPKLRHWSGVHCRHTAKWNTNWCPFVTITFVLFPFHWYYSSTVSIYSPLVTCWLLR